MAEENLKVLVVEDESSIRKFINIHLSRNSFDVLDAASGEAALEMLKIHNPDIIILDIMLPGIDGFEVCRTVRRERQDIIIIMLTARAQDMDKISGLELGADDYMVKPFNPLELVARIHTILRRTRKPAGDFPNNVLYKDMTLDLNSQKFFKSGKEIELTPTEFSLLKVFITSPGKAVSRNELLNRVWGRNFFGDLKTVDVYIRRLREKIEDNPSEPQFIETVWGYGYRWQQEN